MKVIWDMTMGPYSWVVVGDIPPKFIGKSLATIGAPIKHRCQHHPQPQVLSQKPCTSPMMQQRTLSNSKNGCHISFKWGTNMEPLQSGYVDIVHFHVVPYWLKAKWIDYWLGHYWFNTTMIQSWILCGFDPKLMHFGNFTRVAHSYHREI